MGHSEAQGPLTYEKTWSQNSRVRLPLTQQLPKASYTWISLQLLPVPCSEIGFFKINPRASIGLEIRPQSALTSFRALLPSTNFSAKWSGRVWLPSADSNGRLVHVFF